MNIFEIKKIADKLLSKFPWNKNHGKISVFIGNDNTLRVQGDSEAITVVIHSDILTEKEKEIIVYEL